jgi:hypothetical protein
VGVLAHPRSIPISARVGIGVATHVGVGHRSRAVTAEVIGGCVDSTQALSIAARHGQDFGSDEHQLTVGVLCRSPAVWADAERDLVAGAAWICGSAEDAARHREQEGVVIEPGICVAAEPTGRFAEEGECLGRDVEAQDVAAGARLLHGGGGVTGPCASDDLFELSHALVERKAEPLGFGLWTCHARQLSHRGPAEGAVLEGVQ